MGKASRKPNRSKEPYAFWISPDQKAALRAIKERDGVSEAEQIRRGIKLYLESKGYTVKKPTKKAKKGARKR